MCPANCTDVRASAPSIFLFRLGSDGSMLLWSPPGSIASMSGFPTRSIFVPAEIASRSPSSYVMLLTLGQNRSMTLSPGPSSLFPSYPRHPPSVADCSPERCKHLSTDLTNPMEEHRTHQKPLTKLSNPLPPPIG